jgi:type IV pilus assembly protein PilA
VTAGVITVTFATGVGTGVDSLNVVFTPTVGSSNVTWANTMTVTNATAMELINKNN